MPDEPVDDFDDEPTPPAPAALTAPDDPAKEAAKWREMSRMNERDKIKLQRENDKLRQQTMSDTEKAVAVARSEARLETLREIGLSRVDDAVRIATASRSVDVDALLEGLDRSRFLDEDGQPDRKAITKWVDRIAPAAMERAPVIPSGPRGTEPPKDMNALIRRTGQR